MSNTAVKRLWQHTLRPSNVPAGGCTPNPREGRVVAPPWSGWLSIISTSKPACLRKEEMPSGRWYGPEKSRSTVRDASAGFGESGTRVGIASCSRVMEFRVGAAGNPGGWSTPAS
eukprot:4610300-Pleurochrysis_carterae.AAC.4